jgi:hypothetical protein
MISVEFVQFGVLLMFWTAVLRFLLTKLKNSGMGTALAFVTP